MLSIIIRGDLLTLKHVVKHRINHVRQSQDISIYESVDGEADTSREQITITQPEATTPSPSKKETIRTPLVKSIYHLLPFSELKTKQCGQFLPYHFGHISRVPDLYDENGKPAYGEYDHMEYSGHVPQRSMTVNCNSILCEWCNYQHDTNGNIIYDENGYPVPAGAWQRLISSHSDKLRKFQELTGRLSNGDNARQNLLKLFYGKRQTHHAKSNVFYILVDRKMGPKQRANLNKVIFSISRNKVPLNIYHHVLSPPSSWSGWETEEGTKGNIDHAIDLLREVGCFGGYLYFHPYRIPGQYNDRIKCADGPHYHYLGFSHIMQDVEKEIYDREGVIIKALHFNNGHVDPVKSVEKTIAYITSHVAVQRTREPIVRDLELLEKYHFVVLSEPTVNGEPKSFSLPDGESNLETNTFHFPSKPLIVSPDVFTNSLSYFTFLKTDGGRLFQLMRRHIKSILDQNDLIMYSITIRSNYGKKDRKIVMRSFGILSNSKNFIWGFKREKPQFYCSLCKMRIPLTEMFPCNVLSESLIGVKGPPPEPSKDADIIADLEYTEAKQAYEDRLSNLNSIEEKIQSLKEQNVQHNLTPIDHPSNKDGYREDTTVQIDSDIKPYFTVVEPQDLDKYYQPATPGGDIYKIPLQYIQRLDVKVADVVKTYFKVRK